MHFFALLKMIASRLNALKDLLEMQRFIKDLLQFIPDTLKYWVGVQRGQSYLMGRRCLFSLGWPPF